MPGLIINGKSYDIPGLTVRNWLDNPKLKLSTGDGQARTTSWVRQIINHTTKGIPGGSNNTPQSVRAGKGPANKDIDVNQYWYKDANHSGAHTVIGSDGVVGQTADLFLIMAYHATSVNPVSVGNEMYQEADASIYAAALDAAVLLTEWQCRLLGIQRQIHKPYTGPISRLASGGTDCVGVFGHRDQTGNRGRGDPGDLLTDRLEAAGFEVFDFGKNEDKKAWAVRQQQLGLIEDGIPGPQTIAKLKSLGYPYGLWTLKDKETPKPNLDVKKLICKALGCDH